MIVKITDFGKIEDKNFINYNVSALDSIQMDYIKNNLDEEVNVADSQLIITMYFDDDLYPFQSDISKIRLDDFIAREEIEMNVFLSSFLEDM